MKIFALAALALAVSASASLAEPRQPAQQAPAANRQIVIARRAPVGIGRDGQDANQHCPTDATSVEYRDCVNASTRDPNAKVRLG